MQNTKLTDVELAFFAVKAAQQEHKKRKKGWRSGATNVINSMNLEAAAEKTKSVRPTADAHGKRVVHTWNSDGIPYDEAEFDEFFGVTLGRYYWHHARPDFTSTMQTGKPCSQPASSRTHANR